ncbi:MAG: S-layer homology domain-containing protein [Defluviitaleaceae bacterium]|nr:S-layer homology domain-containing protein [Defluviitaleaceae bacterium]
MINKFKFSKNKLLTFFLSAVLVIALFPPVSARATGPQIQATLEGLEAMFVGVQVNARVVFELDSGEFNAEIFPQDFFIGGLPGGLRAETAVRVNNNTVAVNITGAPTTSRTFTTNLTASAFISARNVRNAVAPIPVTWGNRVAGQIQSSADIWPTTATFDIYENSELHRDISVNIILRDRTLRRINYGAVVLREDTDFTRNLNNNFVIHTSFLNRLPVGEWQLTFVMDRGANPTLTITVTDSTLERQPEPPFDGIVGPPPAAPPTPVHPNDNFIYLTGGIAVNVDNMRWDLDRARVRPEVHNGLATVTVRTHVLDYLAWYMPPGENISFEILTPMTRVRIPVDILDTMFGGRDAIVTRGLEYNEVDLRISLIDRSEDDRLRGMFSAVYPTGQILSPIVELRYELIETRNDRVIFTAHEFARPIHKTFVVMDNAGHLRPAGVSFARAWLEFVPYRTLTPNEITISSIFPGVQGVVHNRMHFEDIYTVHWGFVQSYTAAYSGLVAPAARLEPGVLTSRGEFAHLLASTLQLPRAEADISGFRDVPPSHVFFDGISRMFEAGLLGPYTGGNFHPNAIITREEIASIAGMALTLFEPERIPNGIPLSVAFSDFTLFNIHHVTNAQTAFDYRVMVGYPDGTFRPQMPATRIYALEAVINLARALGLIDEV